MSHLQRSNGHPEPEVIVNYADGYAYSKGKMEEAFRILFDKPPVKPPKAIGANKREDVDLIVSELDIPRAQAEKVLTEHGGDLEKALQGLVTRS
ncbi:hypothetical protein FA95DRAFT_1600447 [Auriscalpium vulgare]|uniref:Uncharacterized protein n=1 Tax=Auriscalpium vulgare TaxID=40419 RepID=A0ACB8SDE4_9AGAM|nr:hypothetical protein FA95DRAFT_1600447 [Auriscalpium vulgare]